MSDNEPMPPPSAAEQSRSPGVVRPLAGYGLAATILIGLVAALVAAVCLAMWSVHSIVAEIVGGTGTATTSQLARLSDTERLSSALRGGMIIAALVAALLLLLWLNRARANAESISPMRHRLSKGWVTGGWFCPVVNLWFPAVVMTDICRASDSSRVGAATPRHPEAGGLVVPWWIMWIVGWWLPFFYLYGTREDVITMPAQALDVSRTEAVTYTMGAVGLAGAAVCLTLIIRRVSSRQEMFVSPSGA
ncbi:uncharacterized protein DUF4328 [Herbihabitans rhizosphaerae]|uniref:Uncharacterized protein DUF4328 n=1 Tax=Herbihabitans rhizosphaerae TaxID=1872711 RepID=A0A4V2EUG5_9PSEU|nr:DUF4328 domain-containing protein [Herbihabitans rhizosphaerae]RZS44493.1 uncharacterized protein DUF4328 [Herbihabitans rhizosphaerae]